MRVWAGFGVWFLFAARVSERDLKTPMTGLAWV
jgi:hypothetical protein